MVDNNNIKKVIAGRCTSLMAAGMFNIALPLYLLQISNSLTMTGFYFSTIALPPLIISPFLGVWADRCNRKHAIVCCDLFCGLIYLLMSLIMFKGKLDFIVLLGFSIVTGMIQAYFSVVSSVLFTELNDEHTLQAMSGLKSVFENSVVLIAPMLGTLLYGYKGFALILCVCGLLYVLSAIQESFIIYHKQLRHEENQSMLVQIKAGFNYVINDHNLFLIFGLVMILNFFVANGEEIITPGILIRQYGIDQKLYGFASAFFMAGTLLAGYLIYRLKERKIQIYRLFIVNSTLMIIVGILARLMQSYDFIYYFLIYLILQFFIGMLTSMINIPLITYFQTYIPITMQGRFFAILRLFSGLLVPLGISYTGWLADGMGADLAYIINNLCVILFLIIFGKKIQIILGGNEHV